MVVNEAIRFSAVGSISISLRLIPAWEFLGRENGALPVSTLFSTQAVVSEDRSHFQRHCFVTERINTPSSKPVTSQRRRTCGFNSVKSPDMNIYGELESRAYQSCTTSVATSFFSKSSNSDYHMPCSIKKSPGYRFPTAISAAVPDPARAQSPCTLLIGNCLLTQALEHL